MTLQIDNVKLIPQERLAGTYRNFPNSIMAWAADAGGAYDLLEATRKMAELCGNQALAHRALKYVSASAVPRLPAVAIDLMQSIHHPTRRGLSAVSDAAHQFFDLSAMISYVAAFFSKNPDRFVNAGTALDAAADTSDTVTFIADLKDWCGKLARMDGASSELIGAIRDQRNHTLLKLAKAVTAAVVGFFSCWFLMTSVAIVPAAVALAISLISTFFSIASSYYDNYAIKHSVIIDR
jgi:hypothetical protein